VPYLKTKYGRYMEEKNFSSITKTIINKGVFKHLWKMEEYYKRKYEYSRSNFSYSKSINTLA
jgi:hypothetical protein